MATSTLEFACVDGLTLTAELYTPGTDTLVQGAIACTEWTNNKSVYTASIVDVASGVYRLRVRTAANVTILTDGWAIDAMILTDGDQFTQAPRIKRFQAPPEFSTYVVARRLTDTALTYPTQTKYLQNSGLK